MVSRWGIVPAFVIISDKAKLIYVFLNISEHFYFKISEQILKNNFFLSKVIRLICINNR